MSPYCYISSLSEFDFEEKNNSYINQSLDLVGLGHKHVCTWTNYTTYNKKLILHRKSALSLGFHLMSAFCSNRILFEIDFKKNSHEYFI